MRSLLLTIASSLGLVSVASAQLAAGPSFQTFISPELGLGMTYSAAFTREDPAHLAGIEFSTYTFKPAAAAAAAQSCTHVVFALSSGLDLPVERPAKGQPTILPAKGTLAVTEVDSACVDKTQLDDTLVQQLVGAAATGQGLRPLGHMTDTYVDPGTVWWSSNAGYLKNAKGKRDSAAGTVIMATAGAPVHGHLLIWSISANSPELFNRFASVSVCFTAPACATGYAPLTTFRLNLPKPVEVAAR